MAKLRPANSFLAVPVEKFNVVMGHYSVRYHLKLRSFGVKMSKT